MIALIRKLLQLFDRSERKRIALLLVTALFRAIVEAIGVASILPFMALVAHPGIIQTNRWLHALYAGLHFTSEAAFLVFVGFVVLAVTLVSNGLSAFSTWYMHRFVWAKHHALGTELLNRYLDEPYSYYLNRNTAAFTKNIVSEVALVIRGLLTPLVNGVASALVVLLIFALLLAVNPQLALIVVGVLGGAYAAVYTFVRRRQGQLGRRRVKANKARYQAASEAFGAIKVLKVSHREAYFVERFEQPSSVFARTMASNQIIASVPRYAMQSLAFGGILLVVLYLLFTERSLSAALPMMSLYALAAYRLMPALQQLFAGVIEVRFNAPALDLLHADLSRGKRLDRAAAQRRTAYVSPVLFQHEFALESVTFAYDGAAAAAIRDLSLHVRRNSAIGLIGPTGAGKTTLVDIILGLLLPQEGQLTVDGVPIDADNVMGWQRLLGYVPQHIYLSDDTMRRNIAFGVSEAEIDEERVLRAVRIAHLDQFVAELPKGVNTRVGERGIRLSGGQRQRIGIARALYHDPEILIFDEATSALDGITERGVMQAIRSLTNEKTIIMVAHRLTTVRDCEIIYLMQDGRITSQGSYGDMVRNNETVRAMAFAGAPS
jgi:ABC-type bacteriocin/lantibiotic exporter with double-glycine peptidase domain